MLNKHIWTFLFKSNPFGSCSSEYGLLSPINIPWESVRNGESHALPRPTESEADFHKILRSSVYTVKCENHCFRGHWRPLPSSG